MTLEIIVASFAHFLDIFSGTIILEALAVRPVGEAFVQHLHLI